MCRRPTYLVLLVWLLGIAVGPVAADLIAYYPFEEGAGTTTEDVTGNGNDGTFNGDVAWVPGFQGTAVGFDTAGERIVIGPLDPTAANDAMTLAAWINWEGQDHTISQQGIIGKRLGWDPGTNIKWFWQTNPSGDLLFRADAADGGTGLWWGNGLLVPYANEWTHVALTWDNGAAVQYINGEEVSTGNVTFRDTADATPVTIGCVDSTNNETFVGSIDEARIYDTALTAQEIALAMQPGPVTTSSGPVPASGATDVRRDAVLSWTPGEFAAAHDAYLGMSFDDVNDASRTDDRGVLVSLGQSGTSYDHDVLFDIGRTYYWRIDDVNAPPDSTVSKGAVWSFTVEPLVYPVQNIVATASSSDAGYDPANTINGSGLDADDLHSDDENEMWLSLSDPNGAWIQYEFDDIYKLTELWVWNYNSRFEVILGYGFKDVTVEVSTDGETWTVATETQFEKAAAKAGYAHNTVVDMGGARARYVRLTANTNWSPMNLTQFGLSEVRFYHLPVAAREPQPSSGAIGVGVDAVLSWRPGRQAAAHEVYFNTDEQAVADGTALVDTITEVSYAPGPLDYGTRYYWKIVEVNEAETPAAWESAVWDFTTAEYMAVDDFESYTNDSPDRVFQAWIDGWGFSADEFFPDGHPGNGTGAAAGHDIWTPGTPHYEGSIIETDIVNSGRQALPMYYDNTAAPFYSEVERTFTPAQDWTANGADTLKLAFRGNPIGFVETAAGEVTMSGEGADIYNQTDEFRFAYKRLTGDGSITVRVESIENTHEWAKAGVMIRAGLDTLAQQVHTIAAPSNRVEFMYRSVVGATTSAVATDADSTPLPQWLRLTRNGNTITGEYSADGVTWTQVTGSSSVTMSMLGDIYIGLAVTSHVSNVPATAEFSNVQTSGAVSGQWQVEEIGVAQLSNDRADLYMVLTDSTGRQAMLTHPDPDAVLATSWTDWEIPISELADAGINPAAVTKMAIGVGDPAAAQADASGLIYIDDILVGHPMTVVPVNLLTNGGFEDGVLEPWWLYDNTGGGATAEVVSDDVVEGNSSLHITVPTVGENYWDIGLGTGGLVFRAGRKYTLSVFLKCKEGTLDVNLKPELGADPWTGFGNQVVTITDQWAEYSVTTPVFAEDTSPGNITLHIGFAAGEVRVDGARFYEGDYVPAD